MQSKTSAFDVMVYKPNDLMDVFIAGEIKKSSKEIDDLLRYIQKFNVMNDLHENIPESLKNAHRKWMGLRQCRAPLFWTLGPDCDSRLFKVSYSHEGDVMMDQVEDDMLYYKKLGPVTNLFDR